MFRKLVSNLPYSPALIGDVGFYAKRLRNEEVTRQTTVLFVVLALIMQSVAVFSPPESVNASSEQDIIRGGVSDLNDFLVRYDHNEQDVKDIYSAVGISRAEIAAAKPGLINPTKDAYLMSRFGQLTATDKEISFSYQRSAGGTGIRYFSPLAASTSYNQSFNGWIGQSTALGWFGIIQANGSLVTRGLPAAFDPVNNETAGITKHITAHNLSQGISAEKVAAKPLDKISYTMKLTNTRSSTITGDFSIRISDALEYATIIDGGGGDFSEETGVLTWPSVQLRPGQYQERTFALQLLSNLPTTAVGQSNPSSYDCRLTVVFGNEHTTPADCPGPKGIEAVLYQLPRIGSDGNVIFGLTLAAVVIFYASRAKLLRKEIRIIRHSFNTGII